MSPKSSTRVHNFRRMSRPAVPFHAHYVNWSDYFYALKPIMPPHYIVFPIIIMGMTYAVMSRKLTRAGALVGGILGSVIFLGTGLSGFTQMAAFFLLGSAATKWHRAIKLQLLPEEKGERTAGQVLANAGVAGALAVLAMFLPAHAPLLTLMVAASFSSATADTISSELGTVYGKRFFNILTWKPDRRGENGVISIEGTLWGLGGSAVIAIIHASLQTPPSAPMGIILAGSIGNLSDSVLGAALERRGWIGNDVVNILNTLIAALTMLILCLL